MEAEARITSVENWQIQRQGWTFEVTDKAKGSHFGKVVGLSNFQKLIDLKSVDGRMLSSFNHFGHSDFCNIVDGRL